MKMGIGRAAVVAGALAVGGALVPATASAATPSDQGQAVRLMEAKAAAGGYKRCPKYRFCGFNYKKGKGGYFKVKKNYWKLSRSWDNKISSVYNRTKKVVCIYPNRYYKGRFVSNIKVVWIKPHKGGTLPKQFNNKISSFKFAKTSKGCPRN